MSEPLLTTKDLCTRYSVTPRTLENWRKKRGFPDPDMQYAGGPNRYKPETIEAWENSRIEA